MNYGVFIVICTMSAGLMTCNSTAPQRAASLPAGERAMVVPDDPRHVRVLPESEVRLSGRATIGSWRAASRTVEATVAPGIDPGSITRVIDQLQDETAAAGDAREIELPRPPAHSPEASLSVPVRSLRSGNAAMERDLQDALKADQFPAIEFELDRIGDVAWRVRGDRVVFEVEVHGSLSLAGQARPIDMKLRIEPLDGNRFAVLGAKAMRMTDFGVEPPSALFGAIRAHDRVEVVFDLVVEDTRQVKMADGSGRKK